MNYNYYQPYQFNNVPSQVQRLQKRRYYMYHGLYYR